VHSSVSASTYEPPWPDRAVKTILFTDIEGSSRLWEREPERMGAPSRPRSLLRNEVGRRGGSVIKSTGDGMLARSATRTARSPPSSRLQLALRDASTDAGLPLRVRAGLHAAWSRTARRFVRQRGESGGARDTAAHGGQVSPRRPVAELVRDGLPDGITLRDLGTVRLRDC